MVSRNLRDKLESKETIKLGNQTQSESGGQFLWFIVYKSRHSVPGIFESSRDESLCKLVTWDVNLEMIKLRISSSAGEPFFVCLVECMEGGFCHRSRSWANTTAAKHQAWMGVRDGLGHATRSSLNKLTSKRFISGGHDKTLGRKMSAKLVLANF